MKKYWVATLKNGQIVKEGEKPWNEIENNISRVSLVNGNQLIILPNGMEEYGQAKTASADLLGSNVNIESRYCWFRINGQKIIVRLDEKTNDITIET